MAISGKQITSREPHITTGKTAADESNNVSNSASYATLSKSELPRGADRSEMSTGDERQVEAPNLPKSQFNSFYLIRVKDVGGNNYPRTDEESARTNLYENVTARKLIENPRGASIFRAEDFLYAAKYGIVPNNRMITLRRFPYPVFDDIFSDYQTEPDVARLITYSDQEVNKISELMSFTFGMRWKDLKSNIEEGRMLGGNDGIGGWMRNVLRYVDPKFGKESLDARVQMNYDPLYDANKTYGPVDSIDEMYIRGVGLNFDQSITLSFEYQMKSINGVNQKTAFLDLLSHIFLVTTNDAKFWGGARYWVGPKPTKYMDNLKFMSPKNYDDFLNGATVQFKSFLGSVTGPGGAKNILSSLKNLADNALNLSLGKMLDKLGRPGVNVTNSLLTGNPTGEWHLTVGNPMNPIFCAGDLILESTTVKLGDELGYDDFPTTITVECNLKHNKPRGRAEIESMFNAGRGRIYFKPEQPFQDIQRPTSPLQQPSLIGDILNAGIDTLSGNFDKEALIRTGKQFWGFATDIDRS